MNNKSQGIRQHDLQITRRQLFTSGGAALVGLSLRGDLFAMTVGQDMTRRGVRTINKAKKPVFVPANGSTDPVAHSLAENLFWLDQETEHAKFYIMHMPSPELDVQRSQAKKFQTSFAGQLEKVRSANLDSGNYVAFNQTSIELVKRFLDFKHRMEKAQKTGQLKSLAWPTFFEHTAIEGDRFAKRLERFSRGKVEFDRSEVVGFWTRIMAEHADFIAHLLDPEERTLVDKAMKTSAQFRALTGAGDGKLSRVEDAAEEIIAFKTTAGKGIEAGQIKSIIHPALADHVLREALKFADELKRIEGTKAER